MNLCKPHTDNDEEFMTLCGEVIRYYASGQVIRIPPRIPMNRCKYTTQTDLHSKIDEEQEALEQALFEEAYLDYLNSVVTFEGRVFRA